jgi:hypothetical protein
MDGMDIDSAPSGTKRKAVDEIESPKPARRIRVWHLYVLLSSLYRL